MMLRFLRTLTHSSTSWHVSCTRLVRRPYCSVSVDTKVLECGAQVELHHPRWPHSLYLPYLWLRDHCRCPLCYNHKTHQRIYDVNDINLNIRPAAVSTTKEGQMAITLNMSTSSCGRILLKVREHHIKFLGSFGKLQRSPQHT
ncbi:hypothetical protein OTU49_010965 [Cherax quadricarinatus]|uniref:Gamma-butyrobetaine hydroxylase-like N-terminal domain-containing protein n=1 Tax=Cherax quadricarinatus TaxID=27406 RepID=A0AAW0W679_CHEQU